MKNKFFVRIAASAISITMLGTVAFAAETGSMPSISDVDGDATTKLLSFMDGETNIIKPVVGDGETAPMYVTMMSYVVSADATYAACDYVDEDTTPMIALDQVTYADSFANGVKVAASKLTSAAQIVVKRGDSKGGTDKWLFSLAGETITVINGYEEIEAEVDGDYLILPKSATFDKTPASGYTFTLYSWVAIDNTTAAEGKEYVIPAEGDLKVNVSELEGKTLYAKYDTGIKIGDVNRDGSVKPADYSALKYGIFNNAEYAYVKTPVYTDSKNAANNGRLIGDVNGDGSVKPADYSALKYGIFNNAEYSYVKDQLYIVNKNK